jgi:hypothetical protein
VTRARVWLGAAAVIAAAVATLALSMPAGAVSGDRAAAPSSAPVSIPAADAPASPSATPAPGAVVPTARSRRVPVLAYYYIWMDGNYWEQGKSDLPQLGKYSSDDPHVMRQHIQWAKAAGIDGFIVSWKNTSRLDPRLKALVDVAEQENFKLGIIYEGLDFSRKPLPGGAATVARDLDYFQQTYASRAPFKIFDKPLVIWSGTWEYSPADIATVTGPRRNNLLILASEKNVADYERIADSVDGDAYYWSSVNPKTYKGYLDKLTSMSRAIKTQNGLWLAPAAPGFDARKIGGTNVVSRDAGKTLEAEISAAMASKPDALALISWNEFSENSQLEPSRNFGFQYVNAVGERLGSGAPIPDPRPASGGGSASDTADSSSSNGSGFPTGLVVFPAFVVFFVLLLWAAARRGRGPGRRDRGTDEGPGGGSWPPDGTGRPPAPPGSRRARREERKRSRWRVGRARPAPLPRIEPGPGPVPAREHEPAHAGIGGDESDLATRAAPATAARP